VTGHGSTAPERTAAIGVLRHTGAIAITRTTFTSIVAISTCIGTIATTVDPFAPSQNKSEAHSIYFIQFISVGLLK